MNLWRSFGGRFIWQFILVTAFFVSLVSGPQVDACTSFRIKSADGAVIFVRTMEFGVDLHSTVTVVPRNYKFVGTAPDGKSGKSWKTKYAFIGPNALNENNFIMDGMNEKGLSAALLYLPGYAKYQEVKPDQYDMTIAPEELCAWALSQFSTIEEVRSNIDRVKVAPIKNKLGFIPPLHYVVHDADGNCLVIEYLHDGVKLYDNPLGVMTNSPPLDWHLINLRNYVNLKAQNVLMEKHGNLALSPIGQGSGLLGLPGDYTPPSRFVRIAFLSQNAAPAKTAEEGVNLGFHLMNNIDIALGTVRQKHGEKVEMELTQYVTLYDLKNKRLYYRTYTNHDIRVVDMAELDLTSPVIKNIPMSQKPQYMDVSGMAKHLSSTAK
jgi:choloylglycine hydrolase